MSIFRNLIAAAVAATLSTASMAADATLEAWGITAESDGGDVYYPGGFSSGIAGEFGLKTTAGSFAAYCLEVDSAFGDPGNKYNITTQSSDAIARLFAVAGFNGYNSGADGVDSATKATALQLAIWEVVADGLRLPTDFTYTATDTDLTATTDDGGSNWAGLFANGTAGSFRADGFSFNAVSQATTYLNAAAALTIGSYSPSVTLLTNLDDPHHQNLVTAIPEPSTYALMAACLGVVGFVARRKQA